MKSIFYTFVILLLSNLAYSQSFTSYFTGDTTDIATEALGGTCLMGGATENDEAMKWFLQRASGGDILVLRASGSDGYNDYFFSELGVTVNSVETIVFNDEGAASDDYVLQQIQNAEAIWLAGGNQWNYVNYWRGNQVSAIINENIQTKNIVIGGTSAGMAILGGVYFTAENNTILSSEALSNPYDENLTISKDSFFQVPFLDSLITDTHYDNPDRKGRHFTFLARAMQDWDMPIKGIACDEYTAVCIDGDGIASVYGEFPEFDDNAYFLQVNCLEQNFPETCEAGTPLTWQRNNEAIKVYRTKGNLSGSNFLDLKDWKTSAGGSWQNWYVSNGNLIEIQDSEINCEMTSTEDFREKKITLYPNPIESGLLKIESKKQIIQQVENFDGLGKNVFSDFKKQYIYNIDFSNFSKGVYFIKLKSDDEYFIEKVVW